MRLIAKLAFWQDLQRHLQLYKDQAIAAVFSLSALAAGWYLQWNRTGHSADPTWRGRGFCTKGEWSLDQELFAWACIPDSCIQQWNVHKRWPSWLAWQLPSWGKHPIRWSLWSNQLYPYVFTESKECMQYSSCTRPISEPLNLHFTYWKWGSKLTEIVDWRLRQEHKLTFLKWGNASCSILRLHLTPAWTLCNHGSSLEARQ